MYKEIEEMTMKEIEGMFSKSYLKEETIDRLFAQREKLIKISEKEVLERIAKCQSLEEVAEIEIDLRKENYGISWNVSLALQNKELTLRFRKNGHN